MRRAPRSKWSKSARQSVGASLGPPVKPVKVGALPGPPLRKWVVHEDERSARERARRRIATLGSERASSTKREPHAGEAERHMRARSKTKRLS